MEKFQQLTKVQQNRYNIVKWTSDSYNFQYSHKIGRYVIKADELVCDVVYLNPFHNFKQWYTTYEKMKENNCQVEYCYFT